MSKEKINVKVDFQTSFSIETLPKEDSDTKTTIAKQYYREVQLFLGNDIECKYVNPYVTLTDSNGKIIRFTTCKTSYDMKALLSCYKNDYELSNVIIKIHHQSHPFYHFNGDDILFSESEEAIIKQDITEFINKIFTNNKRSRPTKDDYYLNIARVVSSRSTCLKRQYGAVIVNNDEIISTGYNGAPRGEKHCLDRGKCDRMKSKNNSGDYSDCFSVHAEQNAIISASRREMIGSTLYLVGFDGDNELENPEPCPICSRMIKNSGIVKVITRDNS